MRKSTRQSKSGQSVVEFAFVSMIFLFMLVLTFNTVLAFTVQQYLSYVTFMAARAYQSGNSSPEDQRLRALETFQRYLPQELSGLSLGSGSMMEVTGPGILQFKNFKKELAVLTKVYIPPTAVNRDYGSGAAVEPSASGATSRYVGLEFKVPFVQFPLGEELRARFGYITLTTRSFLGREVSRSECQTFFNGLASNIGAIAGFMEDQGC